jgi:hypothetical protein
MQALKSVLDNQALSVFLGTLPLLLTIAWGLLQSDRRLTRIEGKLDSIDSTLSDVRERLATVEARLDRLDHPKLVS